MDVKVANKRRWAEPETKAPPIGPDLISSLPDDMLRVIIFLLPIEDGVRTTVLSWRWRLLWRCAPLGIISEHMLCTGYRKHLDALSQILGTHCGPIKGLTMGKFRSMARTEESLTIGSYH